MYDALARVDPTLAPNITSYAYGIDRMTLFARTTTLFAACGAFAILNPGPPRPEYETG